MHDWVYTANNSFTLDSSIYFKRTPVYTKKERATQVAFSPEEEFVGAVNWHPTGSNYICDPPVNDTDIDYVVYYKDFGMIPRKWERPASSPGYETEKPEVGNSLSLRWYNYNLIAVSTEDLFNRWVKATEIAKDLNLLKKRDRISLFDAIVRNKDPNNRWFEYIVPWE
jgi:hypothetical protein